MMEDKDLVLSVLDAYTLNRNYEKTDESWAVENKSTDEIIDDLSPMMPLTHRDVNDYMLEHGYMMMPMSDGTVKWRMYRHIQV